MAKREEYRARVGYERLAGKERRYRDVATGEQLSRRQYIKRTEGIPSLESKATRLRAARALAGEKQPMEKFNKLVEGFRKTHGKAAHVRGTAYEAQQFQSAVRELRKKGWRETKAKKKKRWKALQVIGLVDPELPMPEDFGES